MTEQMPDLGIGKATSGVKASFERLMAWAKKNPALVVAALAGVVILVLVMKRRQPTERIARPREDDGDPLSDIGAGVPFPDIPEIGDIELPIPSIPPPPSGPSRTVPSNGASSTTYVEAYTPPSPMLTEMQKMGIDIVHKIRDDPSIPSNIGDVFATNYQKAQMIAKRERARIAARKIKARRTLAARILEGPSRTTSVTDKTETRKRKRTNR